MIRPTNGWSITAGLLMVLALGLWGCPPAPVSDGFPEPDLIVSDDGTLETDLYVQFARVEVSGATNDQGKPIREIWTRAYSTTPADPEDPHDEIPGPTLAYHPGDWLQITLHNQLNEEANSLWLEEFDELANSVDDIKEHVPSEVNIPHNANNTNLHVHGMHVDPKDDNVTLLILPEDDDPNNYTPELQRLIPNIDRWWEWEYGYRIPADHLPGTHWYHAHKHGSTSTHVENGMAGTLLVRPENDADAIVPGLWSDDPRRSHDRVMMLQEIANYGVQQGSGKGLTLARQAIATDTHTTEWPDITVNGEHTPVLELAPGQTERWRFIDAGSNHRTASYLWVGALVPPASLSDAMRQALEAITDFESAKEYIAIAGSGKFPEAFDVSIEPFPGQVKLVALDGVTLHQALDVSHNQPVLLGPGNRADLLVQSDADATGTYYVGKNFNIAPPQYELAQHPDYGDLFEGDAGYWRYQALTTLNGGTNVQNKIDGEDFKSFGDLSHDPYNLGTDFTAFTPPWPCGVKATGVVTPSSCSDGSTATATPLAPLLYGQATATGVDVRPISDGFDFPGAAGLGWAPAGGGPPSVVDSQVLVTLKIEGEPAGNSPSLDRLDDRLNRLSPTTTSPDDTLLMTLDADNNLVPGIPSYVSPIADSDIAGRQVIVFDRSGVDFDYCPEPCPTDPTARKHATTRIHQFSLNGRQFNLQDFVGNSKATSLIQTPVPKEIETPMGGVLGEYSYDGAGNYSNRVLIDDEEIAFFTNPGYYVPIVQVGSGSTAYYTYDNANSGATPFDAPTYEAVTGLTDPRQPVSTTAEEWLLVNNSRIFHPFHIHISPFLLTEVGQVSYSGGSWEIEKLTADDPLGFMLDNWWDVIIIPPQGYVKIRLWLNMPDQKPRDPKDPNTDFIITENANSWGSWVYHCHILRHEDRGMMMVVNVKPKSES